jgi:hypothetical protein
MSATRKQQQLLLRRTQPALSTVLLPPSVWSVVLAELPKMKELMTASILFLIS